MKKLLLSLALAALALSPAMAQSPGTIGVYADEAATTCYMDIGVGDPVTAYVIATLVDLAENGITAAEFKIDNLPVSDYAAGGLVTSNWTSEVIVGDPWTDFSIAWSTPQGAGGGLVLIGTLDFICFNPAWVPTDHMMTVVEGETCFCLKLVDDLFVSHDAEGGLFWGNCSDIEQCPCDTPTQETSWSDVKSLF